MYFHIEINLISIPIFALCRLLTAARRTTTTTRLSAPYVTPTEPRTSRTRPRSTRIPRMPCSASSRRRSRILNDNSRMEVGTWGWGGGLETGDVGYIYLRFLTVPGLHSPYSVHLLIYASYSYRCVLVYVHFH